MDKEIKNLYPMIKLLNKESTDALIKFLEPYIKNKGNVRTKPGFDRKGNEKK